MVDDGHTEVVLSPTDEALLQLYAGALAVVFPSRMEGFGLPVAEGLAVGTPVIASNLACIREFAGDAPLYIQPGSDRDLSRQVETLLEAGTDTVDGRDRRRSAVSHLQWGHIADVTAQTIEAAVAGQRRGPA
jgi:glycosyltransferase involved in cell wall biosynthesis